eukprot:scaffold244638_cov15-Tisochrysis_lutea.AAC.1
MNLEPSHVPTVAMTILNSIPTIKPLSNPGLARKQPSIQIEVPCHPIILKTKKEKKIKKRKEKERKKERTVQFMSGHVHLANVICPRRQ